MHACVATSWTKCTGKVIIRPVAGETFTLAVEGSDTVESLKTKIQAQVGIPSDEQRLMYKYNGSPFIATDIRWLTLVDNFVANGSTLDVIQRGSQPRAFFRSRYPGFLP